MGHPSWWHTVRDSHVRTTRTWGGARQSGRSGDLGRPGGAAFDALLAVFPEDEALDVDSGGGDVVGVELAGLDDLFDFGDGDFAGGGHHGVEVAGGLAVDEVAGGVGLPGADEGEVGLEPALHEVGAAVEFAGLLTLGDEGANAGGGEEGGDAGSAGADALGEGSLGDEGEVELAFKNLFLEELVFADVGTDVRRDHAGFEHFAEAGAVDAHVVADGVETLEVAADEGGDEALGDAAEAESAEHEGGSVRDVGYGGVGAGVGFAQ